MAPPGMRFGDVALRLGLLNQKQIEVALELQRGLERGREGRRQLIGVLLVELGCLTQEQVLKVLEERDRALAAVTPPSPPVMPRPDPGAESGFTRVVINIDPSAREEDDTDRVVLDR